MIGKAAVRRLSRRLRRRFERAVYKYGDSVECNHCGWTGWRFLTAGTPNRQCPRCGSLERYRALRLLLERDARLRERKQRVLEIAPTECLENYCRRFPNLDYVGADLKSSRAMVWSDLTQMAMKSAAFDLIVCMHVMEHIPDDISAFREIGRLLRNDGEAWLMVPIVGPDTFEDPTAKPEEYERLFGQRDHVRVYGMDIVDRIRTIGLRVRTLDLRETLTQEQRRRYALDGDDRYLFVLSRSRPHDGE